MTPIRIGLADDHTLVRRGLRLLLEAQPDMQVVGEAADGISCLQMVAAVQPDVVLMDVSMPHLDGIETTQRITSLYPSVQVVGLTMHDNERYFFSLLEAGVVGYLRKDASPEDLLAAIRMAARGETYLDPALARMLVGDYHRRRQKSPEDNLLSERELQVLRLIAAGKTGREIAEELTISQHTVDRHRANLLVKLQVHNKVQLVQFAIQRGLLSPGPPVTPPTGPPRT